jgi:hypothetical protein
MAMTISCWSRWCCRPRRPMSASTRRRARCSRPSRRRRQMVALGEEGLKAAHPHHRPVQRQGEERHRAVRNHWSRDFGGEVPQDRDALDPAARRRPQDRQCRDEHRVRRGDLRGRHPHLPRRQSHRPRAGQDAARSRAKAGLKAVTPPLPPRRASLADPARPLCLQGAHARMLALPGGRPVPL